MMDFTSEGKKAPWYLTIKFVEQTTVWNPLVNMITAICGTLNKPYLPIILSTEHHII
jgi:hypothetical protein